MNVPKLRFPEFWEMGAWEETYLGQVVTYENGKAHEQDIDDSGKFVVVNSKFISTEGEVRKYTNSAFCIAEKKDILMVLSDVPNGRAIAKCFWVDVDNRYTINQRICRLSPHKAISLLLFYVLNRNSYFLEFDDGVKQTNLKKDDVLDCPVLLPKDIDEQQKIADCLSSLDELMTAETQKLEAYKQHKKGLMQQLFPQTGETTPRLRFPEFREMGDWEVSILGESDISTFVKERVSLQNLSINNYVSTENLLPDYEGVTTASKLPPSGSFTRFKVGDVLISNIRPYLKKVWAANKDGASSNDVVVIRAQSKISHLFLSFLLKNDDFIDYVMEGAKGVKMPRGDIYLMKG